jgi:hypothetical protein
MLLGHHQSQRLPGSSNSCREPREPRILDRGSPDYLLTTTGAIIVDGGVWYSPVDSIVTYVYLCLHEPPIPPSCNLSEDEKLVHRFPVGQH